MNINPANINPLWNGILIRQKKAEEKTTGGIIMPDEVKDRGEHSEIYAEIHTVGSTAFEEFDDATQTYIKRDGYPKVGDTVMFKKYSGGNFIDHFDSEDGYRYRLIDQTDILAVIKE